MPTLRDAPCWAFTPQLPDASHLYTALVVAARGETPNPSSVAREFYGVPCGAMGRVNHIGNGAAHVARRYFHDTLTGREVLVRHTAFGYYSLGLSAAASTAWSDLLSAGSYNPQNKTIRTSSRIPRGSGRPQLGLKWCPECASLDLGKHGFTSWSWIHQIPHVTHCPIHLEPLRSPCAACGAWLDNGLRYTLPGEPCKICGSTRFKPIRSTLSAPHARLIKDVHRFCKEQQHLLRPLVWEARMRTAWEKAGGVDEAVDGAQQWLLDRWNVKRIEDIGAAIGVELVPKHVRCAVSANVNFVPVVAQMLLLPIVEDVVPTESPDDDADGLQQLAETYGISTRHLGQLKSGLATKGVMRESGLSGDSLHVVLRRLRTDGHVQASVRAVRYANDVRYVDDEQRHSTYEMRVRQYVKDHPDATRGEVRRQMARAVHWLSANDPDLLHRLMPLPRHRKALDPLRIGDERQAVASARRHLLLLAAAYQTTTRSKLFKRAATLVAWLLDNDAAWLAKRLPKNRCIVLTELELREAYRSILTSGSERNPTIAFSADGDQANRALEWLRAHDRQWLRSHLRSRDSAKAHHAKSVRCAAPRAGTALKI
jgi:hypothetical protein